MRFATAAASALMLRCLGMLVGATLLVLFALAPALAQRGENPAAIEKRYQQLYDRGDYEEALIEAQRFEAAIKATFGTKHINYAVALAHIGNVYKQQGKYVEAEELLRRALAITEVALGANHPETAKPLVYLALVLDDEGRYAEAVELLKRASTIQERALGPNHPDLSYSNLGIEYWRMGRYAEAEPLFKRDLAMEEKAHGANSPDVAGSLNNLAVLYYDLGRYAETEALYKRALKIWEKVGGPDHPAVLRTLHNLANLYQTLERYADAEALLRRVLSAREKKLGADHPDTARTAYALAVVTLHEGHYSEAEKLFRRALMIHEQALGSRHSDVAGDLGGLAGVYSAQGRHREAEELLSRVLAITEETLGANQLETARALANLASEYSDEGKHSKAVELLERALGIRQKTLAANNPDVAETLNNLAILYDHAHETKNALAYSRQATAAVIAHTATEASNAQQKSESSGLLAQRAGYFLKHIAYLDATVQERLEPLPAAAREAFEMAQWANHSSAGAAVQQMGLRFAAGNDALAALVRERQDLSALWRDRDRALLTALSQPGGQQSSTAMETLRRELAETENKIAALRTRLEKQFPDYSALTSPSPLEAEELQQLLRDDEALVFWLSGARHWELYVFALTREGFEWKTIPLKGEELSQKIVAFRRGLDVDALHRGLERMECSQAEADKRGLSRIECGRALANECAQALREGRGLGRAECAHPELFDLALAHELYKTLVGPVEPLIKDKRHLIVVPSGALTALPFHLLVTEKPATAAPGDLAGYRNAQWLLKRHAVSVLPSVASLKALRVFARKEEAKSPLIGFGDPVFNADEESKPNAEQRRIASTRSYTEFWEGVDIDRSLLSKALPRLPETAAELRAVAQNLGAPPSSIHLRQDASETTVKRAALADYRVVYFATHGLVAGEVKGLAEPSLALTLPKQPSDLDDGLLTASEVAQLKLNADWVVLSACNTIAGDKPGAEALSGLARAFFYAGARALLVSHWAVESNAAMRLTTSTFDIMKSDPTLGRAEALRRARPAHKVRTAGLPCRPHPSSTRAVVHRCRQSPGLFAMHRSNDLSPSRTFHW
jgi:CHAT domain-containing protein/lipopolysaccharide biosynthesis regulator YciM